MVANRVKSSEAHLSRLALWNTATAGSENVIDFIGFGSPPLAVPLITRPTQNKHHSVMSQQLTCTFFLTGSEIIYVELTSFKKVLFS